jgi:hypothetical protein
VKAFGARPDILRTIPGSARAGCAATRPRDKKQAEIIHISIMITDTLNIYTVPTLIGLNI